MGSAPADSPPIRPTLDALLAYCEEAVGEALRTLLHYNAGVYDPFYTRDDIHEIVGGDNRERYRYPLWQLHKSARQLSRLADHLEYPDVLVRSCGAIKILQFPFAAEAGIVVSVDCEDELPCGFVAECTRIIDDRET